MAYIYINDRQYAAIIRHTTKTPSLYVRELVQEDIEQNGWDQK